MFVDVLVDRGINQALTYRIKPEQLVDLKPGIAVKVPLGPKTVFGVVIKLKRKLSGLSATDIRPLTKIVSPKTWCPGKTLALAKLITRYSGHSMGNSLFRLLPKPGQQSVDWESNPTQPTGQILHVISSRYERLERYRDLVARTTEQHRQCLIVLPKSTHEQMYDILSRNYVTAIATASLSPGKQRQLVSKLVQGEIQVLIGTRHIIGWPANNLGLIVIDDPMNRGHQDDQKPYLDSATLGWLRSIREDQNLIFGSSLPTLGMKWAELNLKIGRLRTPTAQPRIRLIRSSPKLSRSVVELIRTGKQVDLVAPRKGIGGELHCRTCDYVAACSKCQGSLDLKPNSSEASCFACNLKTTLPTSCPTCQGQQLVVQGIGVDSLKLQLVKEFDHQPENVRVTTIGELAPQPDSIVVFTGLDSSILAPRLSQEIFLANLVLEIACDREVIIQTSQPEHKHWQLLTSNFDTYLNQLLAKRTKSKLPPITQRILIELKANSSKEIKKIDGLRLQPVYQTIRQHHDKIELLIQISDYQKVIKDLASLGLGGQLKVGSVLSHGHYFLFKSATQKVLRENSLTN